MDNFKNIKDYHIGCNEVSDIVLNAIIDTFNWLEKGGDKNKVSKHVEAINEEKFDNANKVEPKDYSSIDPHFFKTTDKVEPKFHEGEWIVWQNKCYKVYYNGCGYELIDQDGLSTSLEYGTIDESAHLWDITKDAKDGDVLAISWWEDNNFWEKIIIFKKYHNKGVKGLYCMPCVEGYGNTFKNGKLAFNEKVPYYSKTWTCNLHPATKEQRDTLERAMADAGWEFDFESKELKKIKLKSDDEVEHLIPQKGVYYTCIKDYYSSDNTHLYVKGNIYKSSFNGYINDESHFGLSWTNSCAEKYFEPTKDEDWIVCEHDNVIGKPMQYKEFKEKVNQKFIENLKAKGLTPKLRLWNLQDTKAGDTLVCKGNIKGSNEIKYERICLFNNLDNAFFTLTKTSYGMEEYNIDVNIDYPDNTVPATKEQTEILFMVMKNAGYTFDFEKKELRKIEKPIEWSYEDETNLNNIIWLCNNCIKGTETTWIPSQATKIKHLIETIKEEGLAQQNPAWSEEDEQIILSIEQAMNCASLLNIAPEKMDKIRAWLKSLKDRCTWKPSSLQMECLHDAIKHYHTNGYPASKLKELYEQMSKIYKL